ncbi:MAG: hypothetical protein ABJG45_25905, partial [Rhodopirellula bahusiensis]
HANGWRARSHADSRAVTHGGFSRSSSTAKAFGNWSNARSNSTANSWFGRSSTSRARAVDNRYIPQPYTPPVQNAVMPW